MSRARARRRWPQLLAPTGAPQPREAILSTRSAPQSEGPSRVAPWAWTNRRQDPHQNHRSARPKRFLAPQPEQQHSTHNQPADREQLPPRRAADRRSHRPVRERHRGDQHDHPDLRLRVVVHDPHDQRVERLERGAAEVTRDQEGGSWSSSHTSTREPLSPAATGRERRRSLARTPENGNHNICYL